MELDLGDHLIVEMATLPIHLLTATQNMPFATKEEQLTSIL